jgi:hypothetical protein
MEKTMLFAYCGKITGIPRQVEDEKRRKWMFDFDLDFSFKEIDCVYHLGVKNASKDFCKIIGCNRSIDCEMSLEEAKTARKRRVYLEPNRVHLAVPRGRE